MALNFTAAITMARTWWAFLLRGVLAIIFGVVVLLFPGIGLTTLVLFVAVWMISDGLAERIGAWRTRARGTGGWASWRGSPAWWPASWPSSCRGSPRSSRSTSWQPGRS